MREINTCNRDRQRVATEMGSNITIPNIKLWLMGGLTKRNIESQREEVGQMEMEKMSFRPVRRERFEERREINEEVQWPVSRERLARQNTAVTRIDMRSREPVCCWYGEREWCLCLKTTHLQVAGKVPEFTLILKAGGKNEYPLVCHFISLLAFPVSLFISDCHSAYNTSPSSWCMNWYVWWNARLL